MKMADTLYLKIDKNVQVKNKQVHLKDIAVLSCASKSIENKVKTLRLPTEIMKGPGRYVFDIIDVIETIEKEFPSLEINNLREAGEAAGNPELGKNGGRLYPFIFWRGLFNYGIQQ